MTSAASENADLQHHPFSDAIEAQYPLDVWDLRVFGYADGMRRARFRGRADRAGRGATDITQRWLLDAAKEWVLRAALRQVSTSYIDDVVLSLALLSSTLNERGDRGDYPDRLSRNDITAHLIHLGQLREGGLLTVKGQQRAVRYLARVLEDTRSWGLHTAAARHGLPESFAVLRDDLPARSLRGPDEPSRALPRSVVRQLLEPAALARLEARGGKWAVNWFTLALGTGRRPGELTGLPLDGCLDYNVHRDENGIERRYPVLVHNMPKVGIVGYRLPISADIAAVVEDQQHLVLAAHQSTDRSRLPLFPAPHSNPDGVRAVATWQVSVKLRDWVEELPELRAPDSHEDGRAADRVGSGEFPRNKVHPYALRHTWAQDHADAGTALEVLQDLMGHGKPTTTQVYYRMTQERRRGAVTRLSRLQLSNTGSLVAAGLRVLEAEEGLRSEVGSVAVPFGMCVEPTNVQAGGHSCPYRLRCPGCSHFRTDPSYLPELSEYLSQLLMSRERLTTARDELEPWARQNAMPADEEIERVRFLIRRCEDELSSLTAQERAEVEAAVAQVRTTRAGTTQAVPLQLLGVVSVDEPSVFPTAFQRLRSATTVAPTGRVR
jgi:integrase